MNALIFGITGQDGSYLAEYLLELGYRVIGVVRRSSVDTLSRLPSNVINHPDFRLVEGDLTDHVSIAYAMRLAEEHWDDLPHEIYNLAAQSHVGTSFTQPHFTWDVNAQGVLRILDVMRERHYIANGTKFYQASTSEMFGKNCLDYDGIKYQDETVAFVPCSPYAIAKLAAHNAVHMYRDTHGLKGWCGILFNHESPRRGLKFVTRKITNYVAHLYHARQAGKTINKLQLGNLDAVRDWGHAKDYVRAMHLMLQSDKPTDYIVATGESHSVREFCQVAFSHIGLNYKDYVEVNSCYLRPSEVPHLCGSPLRIQNSLGWKRTISFHELVVDMIEADL
jgi:GDPmannose 4,6-dehydratase